MLLGGILLLYYIMSRYTLDQVLELLLVLGTATIVASIVFALALPQYGLDQMGGHATAWKGIFSAKNYLGNLALFFLTVAVSYRARTPFSALRSGFTDHLLPDCDCLFAGSYGIPADRHLSCLFCDREEACIAFARRTTLSSASSCWWRFALRRQ